MRNLIKRFFEYFDLNRRINKVVTEEIKERSALKEDLDGQRKQRMLWQDEANRLNIINKDLLEVCKESLDCLIGSNINKVTRQEHISKLQVAIAKAEKT